MKSILALAALILVLSPMQNLLAEGVPQFINYQGRLTDANGDPVNDTVSMIFSICNDSVPGSACAWSEEQDSVVVTDGYFNVLLGSVVRIPNVFGDTNRWLEVSVDGEVIEPFARLVSVPYAYQAVTCDTADYALASGSPGMLPSAAYNSGWLTIPESGVVTMAHNLGRAPGDYLVDLQFMESETQGLSGRSAGQSAGPDQGVYYRNLTADSIEICRATDGSEAGSVRVRIWIIQ
jgi:hypothetical protein